MVFLVQRFGEHLDRPGGIFGINEYFCKSQIILWHFPLLLSEVGCDMVDHFLPSEAFSSLVSRHHNPTSAGIPAVSLLLWKLFFQISKYCIAQDSDLCSELYFLSNDLIQAMAVNTTYDLLPGLLTICQQVSPSSLSNIYQVRASVNTSTANTRWQPPSCLPETTMASYLVSLLPFLYTCNVFSIATIFKM